LRGAAALKRRPLTCHLVAHNPRAGGPGFKGPPPGPTGSHLHGRLACAPRTPSRAALTAAAARKATAAALAARDEALGEDAEVREMLPAPADPWADAACAARAAKRARGRRLPAHAPPIPALEVDAPGCSFNPDPAQHQDALAVAVAAEVAAELAAVLAPRPPAAAITEGEGGDAFTGMLTVAGPGAVEEDVRYGSDGEAEEGGSDGGDGGARPSRRAPARKTQAQRNRAARVAAEEAAAALAKAARVRDDGLKSVARIKRDLEEAEATGAAAVADRVAARVAATAVRPPKLGRLGFTPAPLQVALTEDLRGGSLRACRSAANLLRDRFSSVQKRGLVEPRLPAPWKKGKRAAFQAGGRSDRAEEGAAAVATLVKANARARRASFAAAAAADAGGDSDGRWSD
jgi:nucleolar protein 53